MRQYRQCHNAPVICPLCSQRKARRSCPAVAHSICPVCCGTKRLIEIQCPADCAYLASAREHPASAIVRRQRDDVEVLARAMRDLSDRQTRLFFMVSSYLAASSGPSLQPVIDEDVVEAAGALAATFETSVRGVIYEHRPASLPAERLMTDLKPLLTQAAGGHPGTAFERDAAVVLRRIEEAARGVTQADPARRRAFLDLLGRSIRRPSEAGEAGQPAPEAPRLIVP